MLRGLDTKKWKKSFRSLVSTTVESVYYWWTGWEAFFAKLTGKKKFCVCFCFTLLITLLRTQLDNLPGIVPHRYYKFVDAHILVAW